MPPKPTRTPMPNERIEIGGGYYVRSSGKVEQDRWALCRPDGVVISYERGRSPNEFKTLAAALQSPAGEWRSMESAKLCYIGGDTAYFTTCELEKQWGDDWNDAPYEHNAGEPYEWANHCDVPPYEIHKIKFSGPFETPADLAGSNSRYSVEQINMGAVAWLTYSHYGSAKGIKPIMAGASMDEFVKLMQAAGGTVYVPLPPAPTGEV